MISTCRPCPFVRGSTESAAESEVILPVLGALEESLDDFDAFDVSKVEVA